MGPIGFEPTIDGFGDRRPTRLGYEPTRIEILSGILTITKVYLQIIIICSKMVKPVLLVAGAIPVILAIIIVIPLVTTPKLQALQ